METAWLSQRLQVVELGLRVLVEGRDAQIDRRSLHGFSWASRFYPSERTSGGFLKGPPARPKIPTQDFGTRPRGWASPEPFQLLPRGKTTPKYISFNYITNVKAFFLLPGRFSPPG